MLLVLAVGVFGVLYWTFQSRVHEDKGRLSVTQLNDSLNTIVLSWHSQIEVPMLRRFEEAFATWRNRTGRFVIDLSSPGGALYEGRRVIEFIERMKRSHRVDTQVGPGESCLSMCVPIYLQGETRRAGASSKWMFHEPEFYDTVTDEKTEVRDSERRALAERFFEKYIANSPITPAWQTRLKAEWQGQEVWRSGQQLMDERSGIVTELY